MVAVEIGSMKNSASDYLVTIAAKTARFSSSTNLMMAGLKPLTLPLDKTTLTITRSVAAPTGGLTYQLSSDSASLIPPTTIVLPEGQTTASVTVSTSRSLQARRERSRSPTALRSRQSQRR